MMATIPQKNPRGLRDIRTLSGNVDRVSHPYMAYMKITALEMEKARRNQERESAIHRMTSIDARFKEIEAEKNAILKAVGERGNNNHPTEPRGGGRRNPTTTRSKGSALKIRY